MGGDMDVKEAIRTGDAESLRRLLTEDASRANALIRWGKNGCVLTHPLHYVSDMLFAGTLQKGKELPLIEVLIQAGADLNFQRDREDGKKSDTRLSERRVWARKTRVLRCWMRAPGRKCVVCSVKPPCTGRRCLARIVWRQP